MREIIDAQDLKIEAIQAILESCNGQPDDQRFSSFKNKKINYLEDSRQKDSSRIKSVKEKDKIE